MGGLLAKEFFLRATELGQFFLSAILQSDLFARYEENLTNGHVARTLYAFPRLEHITKFAFVRIPIRLDPNNEHRSNGPFDHVEDRGVHGVPAWRRFEIGRSAHRYCAWRRTEILRNNESPHDIQRRLSRRRRFLARECDFFFNHADATHRKHDGDCEDRLPLAAGRADEINELISSFSLVLNMERFVLFERRVDQEPESAPRLQHRAVPRMLRQKRPLALTPRFQAHARPS